MPGQWTEAPNGIKEMWLEYWDKYVGKLRVIAKEQNAWNWDLEVLNVMTRSKANCE